jgi:hypothetical protein
MKPSFEQLLTRFTKLPALAPIANQFNDGIAVDIIVERLKPFGLTPSKSFLSLYEWHNGMKNISNEREYPIKYDGLYVGVSFIGTATFVPFEESLRAYTYQYKHYLDQPEYFKKELYPFCFDDDILFINLNAQSINYEKIYKQNVPAQLVDPMPIFASLYDMFNTLVDGFEKGIYYFDDDGYVEDRDDCWQHGRELNPTCQYWRINIDSSVALYYEYED